MMKHAVVTKSTRWELLLLTILITFMLASCGGDKSTSTPPPPPAQPVAVSVSPASPSVSVGSTEQFTATVTNTSNTAVTWSVQEENGGTIDASGSYTAPMRAGAYHVIATSQADATKSATAAVSVTAPDPVFAAEPPTDAAEATLYSYAVTATDPAGTPVTLALTSAPDGAMFDANTISWTPTWNQSRKSHTFVVTASSEAGGTATQTWSVAPSGTIYGHHIIHFWGPGNDITMPWPPPMGRNPGSIMVWAPQPDGSLTAIAGVRFDDGTFQVPNVPAGPYFFSMDGHVETLQGHWEESSTLYWDSDSNGYPPLDPSQWWPEGMVVNVDGFDPFVFDPNSPVGNDIFQLYDRDGYWDFTSWLPNGATSYTFRTSSMLENAPSPTDRFVAVQGKGVTGIDPFQGLVLGPAWVQRFSQISDGVTSTFAGQLVRSTPGELALDISFSAWANGFNAAAPGTVTPSGFAVQAYSEVKVPNSTLSDPVMQGVIPIFATAQIDASLTGTDPWPKDDKGNSVWPADADYGVLQYNNPFGPEEKTVYSVSALATASIPFPGSSIPVPMRLEMSYATTTPPQGPTVPMMLPVANANVDGIDFMAGGTISTTTPTLTWELPSGRPNTERDALSYDIFVCEATLSGGGRGGDSAACVSTFYISDVRTNSFTVPAGLLQPDRSYIFSITAISERDRDVNNPERYSYPVAISTAVSAAMTVGGSGGGGGKGVTFNPDNTAATGVIVDTPMHRQVIPNPFSANGWTLINSWSSVPNQVIHQQPVTQ